MTKQQNKQRKPSPSQLRIIGGQWRSRKLTFTSTTGLRPTLDAVRETLFNWLSMDVEGARCLDLFAGTGALGLEALSRGAKAVTFVDSSTTAVKHLKNNLSILNSNSGEVIQSSAESWINTMTDGTAFDLVFIDPPFYKDLIDPTLMLINNSKLLAPTAKIYIECEKELAPQVPEDWFLLKQKKAGQLSCFLYTNTNI